MEKTFFPQPTEILLMVTGFVVTDTAKIWVTGFVVTDTAQCDHEYPRLFGLEKRKKVLTRIFYMAQGYMFIGLSLKWPLLIVFVGNFDVYLSSIEF